MNIDIYNIINVNIEYYIRCCLLFIMHSLLSIPYSMSLDLCTVNPHFSRLSMHSRHRRMHPEQAPEPPRLVQDSSCCKPPRQNRPPLKQSRQKRQGNILQYIGKSNGNSLRANFGTYFLICSLYNFLTDIWLFWGSLWHCPRHSIKYEFDFCFNCCFTFTRCF